MAELDLAMRRQEGEVAANDARAASLEAAMRSGASRAPRDVAAMADEVGSLRRRISQIEDVLLERMEEAETLRAELEGLATQRSSLEAERDRLTAELAAAESGLDTELAEVVAQRADLVGGLPAGLLSTYERLRHHLGGVAVARVEGNRCTGCHLTLPATELDALRHAPPGAVVTHEECGRILVPAS